MKNIRVKEFLSIEDFVEDDINKFLMENKELEIIDIKYFANVESSSALIIYRGDE